MDEKDNNKDDKKGNNGPSWYSYLIWGMLVGIVFGAALKNVSLGLSFGLLFGYTFWIIKSSGKK